MNRINIAVFVSGNGSNCENIIRYFQCSETICVKLVVSSKADAFALERVAKYDVDAIIVTKEQLVDSKHLMEILSSRRIQFIVLAGFLPIIPNYLLDAFPRKIINIHPSLLPKYGGKGMWGHHVHEAVKAAGDHETGITIHYVSNVCDGGEIIVQYKVALEPEDSTNDIETKVHKLEMLHYPKVIEQVIAK